jgi:probable F420-dependent oxidoreductase
MARAAEEVGFDSVWLGDHLLYQLRDGRERGPWDTFSLLAALAAVTERVQLGPLVACTAWHAPGILARKAATIQEISGGRFVLGLGAGWNETEFRAFGIPFDHRASRFEEAFEIIRRLLDGERVTFAGRFHQVENAVLLPTVEQRPKLMIGTLGERVLAAALPHVQAWNIWSDWFMNTPEGFAAQNARITEAARSAGRDPDDIERSACVYVKLDRTSNERQPDEGTVPLEPPADRIAAGLRALADAGLQEAILVLDPITEHSIRQLGEVLVGLE